LTREKFIWPAIPEMRSRHLIAVGNSHARRGFRFETLGWGYGQVMACVAGRGRVQIDGRWEICGPGTAYITPHGRPHAYETLDDERWILAWATFEGVDHTPLAGLHAACLIHADPRALYQGNLGLYREVLGASDPEMVHAWLELIHLQAMRMTGTLRGASRLWSIWEAVDADPARPWTVDELADIIGVSGEHLRRLCQKQLGRSPMEQVTHLRMRRAATLLLGSTSLKIDAIARAVGYHDRFGFSVAFKRCLGSTPAAYRLSHQNPSLSDPVITDVP
jgi:AraC-like DNA-binding protein